MAGVLKPEIIGATPESFALFQCPVCKKTGMINEDQFYGRISTECPYGDCGYHETRDWSKEGG